MPIAQWALILLYVVAALAVWLAVPIQIAAALLAVNAIVGVAAVAVARGL
jgi:hypothetical protein